LLSIGGAALPSYNLPGQWVLRNTLWKPAARGTSPGPLHVSSRPCSESEFLILKKAIDIVSTAFRVGSRCRRLRNVLFLVPRANLLLADAIHLFSHIRYKLTLDLLYCLFEKFVDRNIGGCRDFLGEVLGFKQVQHANAAGVAGCPRNS
jgi:hypothetical protein